MRFLVGLGSKIAAGTPLVFGMIIFLSFGIFAAGVAIGMALDFLPLAASIPTLISGDANLSVAEEDDGDFIGKSLGKSLQLS